MHHNATNDHNYKLIKFIIAHFGFPWFRSKSILDVGADEGDLGAAFWRLGSDVLLIDARLEPLRIANKKYAGVETQVCNVDVEWPFHKTFDLIVSVGLLCHIKHAEKHLRNALASCNNMVLETACLDSNDPYLGVCLPDNRDIKGGSYTGFGSFLSPAMIERIFTECGFTYQVFNDHKLEDKSRCYNWQITNTKCGDLKRRRLWIAQRTMPIDTHPHLPLVNNQPNPIIPNMPIFAPPIEYSGPIPAIRYNPPKEIELAPLHFPQMGPDYGKHRPPVQNPFPLPPPPPPPPFSPPPPWHPPSSNRPKMRLFYNHYEETNPDRKKEIDFCLQRNQNNPLFELVLVKSESRPSYQFFFDQINQVAGPDDISVFCNTDIFFDETIALADNIQPRQIYALTRYDWQENGPSIFFDRADSQDVWIVRGKIEGVRADFCLGLLGCDNRIADEFKRAGYDIFNPSRSIKTYHVHNSGIRSYSERERLRGPYLFLPPVALGPSSAPPLATPPAGSPLMEDYFLHVPTVAPPSSTPYVIRLFFNNFQDSRPNKQKEIEFCLNKNRDNHLISVVVVQTNSETTYDTFFQQINAVSGPDDINVICQSDIFFDDTIALLRHLRQKQVYALSSWSWLPGGSIFGGSSECQDSWAFRGPITNVFGGFVIAQKGSDNRLAYEFHKAKYKVFNPSKSVRCHRFNPLNLDRLLLNGSTPGPYLYILPSEFINA